MRFKPCAASALSSLDKHCYMGAEHYYYCHAIVYSSLIVPRVERKERARLKTVKFNAKPGVIDAKGVCIRKRHSLLLKSQV